MTAPECPKGHGPMTIRADAQQTTEQRWCGTWWDCGFVHGQMSRCLSTFLVPSPQLQAQLATQARTGA